MVRIAQVVFIAVMLMAPAAAVAGPAEDANAAVDRWSTAYSGNGPETIAKNYCPDAIISGNCQSRYFRGNSSNHNLFHAYERNRQQECD